MFLLLVSTLKIETPEAFATRSAWFTKALAMPLPWQLGSTAKRCVTMAFSVMSQPASAYSGS